MLEDTRVLEDLWLLVDLLAQVVDRLQFVYAIQKVTYIFYDLLLFLCQGHLLLQGSEGGVD